MNNTDHIIEQLSNGGFVLVLNTNAKIDPQAQAMLQALHSRSTGGIKNHLETLAKRGAEKFMASFYVGYGHKSIGDCASITIFVEGISMLAAKAIQDWRLYSGQEASTRYVDFSQQKFLNPNDSDAGKEILETWRKFYLEILEPIQDNLKLIHIRQADEDEKIYNKAIQARAFDIARAWLPAGATTNVAWTMNLRQFADEIMLLRHHPLDEVRDIAEKTEIALQKALPESFGHKRYDQTEEYNEQVMQNYYYQNNETQDFALIYDGLNKKILKKYNSLLSQRPPKTELPPYISECGNLTYEFLLDFGSFRDLQRHRAIAQRMPLLTDQHGFAQWYLDNLPEEIKIKGKNLLKNQLEKINNLNLTPEIKQYYLLMGFRVACKFTGDLKSLIYLAELRCTRFVHPTLVSQILKMINSLNSLLKDYGLIIHTDDEPNRFDIKRGTHDIVEKKLVCSSS